MNASEAFKYVEDLKEAGVPQKQAEIHLRVLDGIVESNLATKRDIKELKNELKRGMKELDQKMSIRLGAIMVAGIGIIAFLVKL